jgi:hypothetical protein
MPIQLGGPIDLGKSLVTPSRVRGLDGDAISDKEKYPRQDGREKGNLR